MAEAKKNLQTEDASTSSVIKKGVADYFAEGNKPYEQLKATGEEPTNWIGDQLAGGVKKLFQAPQTGTNDVSGLQGTKTLALANRLTDPDDPMALALGNTDQSQALKGSLDALQTKQAGLGGPVDQALQSALQQRAERGYGSDLNLLQRQTEAKSGYEKARAAGRAFQAQAAVSDLQIKRAQFYKRQIENNKALRNNAVAGLFGGLGAIAGGIVGGAAGGSQGAQMGAGLGGTFGSAAKGVNPIEMGESQGAPNAPQPNYQIGGY